MLTELGGIGTKRRFASARWMFTRAEASDLFVVSAKNREVTRASGQIIHPSAYKN